MANEPSETSPSTDEEGIPIIPIIAIGASAGGLSALKQLFAHVPGKGGAAFVVVVHLAPEHESHLTEILQPHVPIPVQQVTETVEIKPDRVYVIPPNANLEAIDSHLHLSSLEARREERAPIDHFFRTLAETHDGRAVGVVLSGSGSDGTLGLRHIKERGGLAVVQDPAEADFDGMPQSAIAGSPVDLVLPVGEIPEAALKFTQTRPQLRVPRNGEPVDGATRSLLQKVFALIRARTERDFSHYKRSTLLRRIARRMQFNHLPDPWAYVDLLRSRPEEVRALADDLLITVTSFFRDAAVFEQLEETVIPQLFENRSPSETIRVWSLGCATGEEAYSLAMLLFEEAERHDNPPAFQVFASDLHHESLRKAREGFYPGDIDTDVPPARLKRFFRKLNGGYQIQKEIRERVIFAPHNILSDPPFSRLDLLSCRNLLIYMKRDLQRQVVEIFHLALRPDGVLLLGTSETVESSELFRIEDKKHCVYRKRNVPAPEPRLPVFPIARAYPRHGPVDAEGGEPLAYGALHHRKLELHGPPSVLVGPDDQVLHYSTRAGRFFVHPGGEPTTSIFKLVREELRIELRAVISTARSENKPVRSRAVPVRFNGESSSVELDVRPASEPQRDGYVLVLFDERGPAVARRDDPNAEQAPDASTHREIRAEKELLEERLQGIIEEYETSQEEMKASNEELQSANEELRSTMEELETSKEELQSMNEELQTVNQENRHKVEELGQLSSDLQNLFAATDIATLFLDRQLRILRFTPRIEDLFRVRVSDRGRPLTDLTNRLGYDELQSDASTVLEKLIPIEREVPDLSGRWYLSRVLPYREGEDRIAGVVVTFVEITERKRAEDQVRAAKEYAEQIIATLPEPLLVLSSDLTVKTANTAFFERFGVRPDETVGRKVYQLGNGQWDIPSLRNLLEKILHGNTAFDGYEVEHVFSELGRRVMVLNARRLEDQQLIMLGIHDVTEQHDAAESLLRTDRQKDQYLAMLGHELRNPLAAIRNATELLESVDSDPSVRQVHGVLDRQTAHVSRIIDGLLDVSRIARGKVHLRLGTIDVRKVLKRIVEDQRAQVAAGIDLELVLEDRSLWLSGDETRLVQVFDNLVGNAIKFTPSPGTVTVSAERDARLEQVVVRVRDTGLGIRPELIPSLFDPFRQASQACDRSAGGLGLGLALVKGLVELHEGSVEMRSEGPNTGTEVEVRLPQAPPPSRKKRDKPASAVPGRRILLVEDNADAAEMLGALLAAYGHDVTVAGSGTVALERLRETGAEVVLCDLGLPGMNGYELIAELKADEALREIPIVAVSGYGQPEDCARTAEAGFAAHLVKPATLDSINATLRRLGLG